VCTEEYGVAREKGDQPFDESATIDLLGPFEVCIEPVDRLLESIFFHILFSQISVSDRVNEREKWREERTRRARTGGKVVSNFVAVP